MISKLLLFIYLLLLYYCKEKTKQKLNFTVVIYGIYAARRSTCLPQISQMICHSLVELVPASRQLRTKERKKKLVEFIWIEKIKKKGAK